MDLVASINSSTSTEWQRTGRGDNEKLLAMFVLGLGSLLFGMIPAIISERNRQRFPLVTSLLLCFGGGVLLATALVHILPEVRRQMESDFAEVSMCAGFFIVYFIDEFINYFCGGATHHQHAQFVNSSSETVSTRTPTSTQSYGAVDEREPLLASEVASHRNENGNNDPMSSTYICDVPRVEHLNMPTSHINHQEPCVQSMTGTLGLFVALSMHAAIEGLTIGVQNSATKVLFLLGAVACHKFVMGFCLGLELRSSTSIRSQFFGVLVFAFGAILGIGIGMLIVELPTGWSKMSLPIIQALAGGTLFYVTVCEVIPREKARWHQNTGRSAAGLAQFASVGTGFTAMCIINFYLSDGD